MIYLRAFLNENLGDDLFVQIIAKRYPECEFVLFSCDDYPVKFGDNVHFLFDKEEYKKLYRKIHLFNRLRNNRIVRRMLPLFFRVDYRKERMIAKRASLNVYVIGSGFMEGGKRGFWQKVTDDLYFANKPYLLGCNFGPFHSDDYKRQYEKLFMKAEDVCFRESYSCKLFNKLDNVRWESDIVFSYNDEVDTSYTQSYGKYIVISVVNLDKDGAAHSNKNEYYKFVADIAESYLQREIKVIFIGFCKKQGDDTAIKKVFENIPSCFAGKLEVINYPQLSIPRILGVFKNAEAIFASRYHAGIIGMLFQKKTYFLSYSDKLVNVLNDIDDRVQYVEINKKINITAKEFISEYGYCISAERLREIQKSANRQFLYLDKVLKL